LFVAEVEGDIIAASALWAWKFHFKGRGINALQPCDTVVHKNFRRKGIFKKMNIARINYAKDRRCDIIYNFPNSKSLPGYLNMGWNFTGKVRWRVKILKPLKVFQSYFKNKQSEKILLEGEYRLTKDKISFCFSQRDNCNIQTFYSNEYIKWRYFNHPSRTYGLINLNSSTNINNNFAIFTLSKKHKMTEMVVTDIFSTDRAAFAEILSEISTTGRKLGVSYIALMEKHELSGFDYISRGFIPKKEKNLVSLCMNEDLENVVNNMNSWNMNAGMHDSI
jgi:hypothetical protein